MVVQQLLNQQGKAGYLSQVWPCHHPQTTGRGSIMQRVQEKWNEWINECIKSGDMVVQCLVLSPHSKKAVGSIPGPGLFSMEFFAFSTCVCVGSLQLPPTVQKHAREVNWKHEIGIRSHCKCKWILVCLCHPAINWKLVQGVILPLPSQSSTPQDKIYFYSLCQS